MLGYTQNEKSQEDPFLSSYSEITFQQRYTLDDDEEPEEGWPWMW